MFACIGDRPAHGVVGFGECLTWHISKEDMSVIERTSASTCCSSNAITSSASAPALACVRRSERTPTDILRTDRAHLLITTSHDSIASARTSTTQRAVVLARAIERMQHRHQIRHSTL
jgi:hypothetical protein